MLYVLIGFAVGIIVLLYFLFYLFGINKIIISFVKSNEIEYRMVNGTLRKILENVPGFILKKDVINYGTWDPEKKEITSSKPVKVEMFFPLEKEERKREHFMGIYWVGILYPYSTVLRWRFSWDKIITEGQRGREEKKGRKVELSLVGKQLISHASEEVTSLYHTDTYPVEVEEVEIVGMVAVSIGFNLKIEVVVPIIPVIWLKGKWLPQFTAMFKGIIIDYLKGSTLDTFEAMDKGKELGDIIYENNDRFISVIGVKVVDIALTGYQIAGSPDVRKAATAGEVARLEGEGTVATATAEAIAEIKRAIAAAKARRLKGTADANALKNLMEKAQEYPGGLEILKEQLRTEGLVGFRGQVLSQGGNTPLQVAVDATSGGKRGKKNKTNKVQNGDDKSGEKGGE